MPTIISERVLVLLALLITAVALFATTFGTEYRLLGAVQSPVFFPRIILGVMIALIAIAIVQDTLSGARDAPVDKWAALIVFVIAALIFANLITRIGFMLSAVPFSILALWVFGLRNPLAIVSYAIIVPGSLVVLFNHVLKLPLPTSPFTYLF
ncbi:tripartite tricarboxylate transporter TctB family protein [Gymnodinialimonas sp.]